MSAADVTAPEASPHSARDCPSDVERFTQDGEDSLERRLLAICETVMREVRRLVPPARLEAVFLGGGYGRGEGGVLKTPDGDQPYNDLEFYVCIAGNRFLNRRRFGPALNQLARAMTRIASVDVEFHIASSTLLRRSKPSIFYYDLIVGHRQLCGDKNLLNDCDQHRDPHCLPLAEATRLLMNRGTGLLFARERLAFDALTAEDRDFIARNIAKAQLALGDAVLTACGQYHWSCRERNRRLATLDSAVNRQLWFESVRHNHNSGVEFKLHPHQSTASTYDLLLEYRAITELMLPVWLWIESKRLQMDFSSVSQYVMAPLNKCPETHPWRNRILNVHIFGLHAMISPASHRHPRERVLNALSILLWESDTLESMLAAILRTGFGRSFTLPPTKSIVEIYKNIWEHVR